MRNKNIENIVRRSTSRAEREYSKAEELLKRLRPFDEWCEIRPRDEFVDKYGGSRAFYDSFKAALEGVVAECKARMESKASKLQN